MLEVELFDRLPDNLTYPIIQQRLFHYVFENMLNYKPASIYALSYEPADNIIVYVKRKE